MAQRGRPAGSKCFVKVPLKWLNERFVPDQLISISVQEMLTFGYSFQTEQAPIPTAIQQITPTIIQQAPPQLIQQAPQQTIEAPKISIEACQFSHEEEVVIDDSIPGDI